MQTATKTLVLSNETIGVIVHAVRNMQAQGVDQMRAIVAAASELEGQLLAQDKPTGTTEVVT